jgi:hypothetical protein
MMVNYVYRLDEVERNHEAYVRDGNIVASRSLQQLAKQSLLAPGRGLEVAETHAAPEPDRSTPPPS